MNVISQTKYNDLDAKMTSCKGYGCFRARCQTKDNDLNVEIALQ